MVRIMTNHCGFQVVCDCTDEQVRKCPHAEDWPRYPFERQAQKESAALPSEPQVRIPAGRPNEQNVSAGATNDPTAD
jgi:hypothetical protein